MFQAIAKIKNGIFLPNRVIWYLTLSDGFSWGSYYALASLIGVYLAGRFPESIEQVVGIGLAVLLISRAVSQLIIGILSDRLKGFRDEIWLLILGAGFMGVPFILFPFITSAVQYFLLQAVIGMGSSMNLVAWRKLFASNLDKGREGLDYGIYDSAFSVISAILSIIAGLLANTSYLWFSMVMILGGGLTMLSGIWAILVSREVHKG